MRGAWQFVFEAVLAEFRAKLARSQLGMLWLLFQPLFQVALYAFVLSHVLAAKLPHINSPFAYALYLMAGILMWSLFSDTLTKSSQVFVEKAQILRKSNYPKPYLIATVALEAIINHFILLATILLIFALLGQPLSIAILWLAPLSILVVGLALGAGTILGVMNVFIRDVRHGLPMLLQLLFWLSPIVYIPEIIPESYLSWLKLNPLYTPLESYHSILLVGNLKLEASLLYPLILALLLGIAATWLLKRADSEITDAL